jgi:hypothetical protein
VDNKLTWRKEKQIRKGLQFLTLGMNLRASHGASQEGKQNT